jgi:hypothetical protein
MPILSPCFAASSSGRARHLRHDRHHQGARLPRCAGDPKGGWDPTLAIVMAARLRSRSRLPLPSGAAPDPPRCAAWPTRNDIDRLVAGAAVRRRLGLRLCPGPAIANLATSRPRLCCSSPR